MLKFIVSNVKILLLRLGLSKREAKDIFFRASKEIGFNEDVKTPYMCLAIEKVIADKYDYLILPSDAEIVLKRYGFTKDNYHAFIKKNYPELSDYLVSKEQVSAKWICLGGGDSLVLKTKELFLLLLSGRLGGF